MKVFVGLFGLLLLAQCNATEKLKLSSGYEIPVVGLGTGAVSYYRLQVRFFFSLKFYNYIYIFFLDSC